MADDNEKDSEKDTVNYVRKKNLISGIDNDHLILGGLGVLFAIGLAPYAKQLVDNFMRNMPQNQYQPANGGGIPQQQGGQGQQPVHQQQVLNPPSIQQSKVTYTDQPQGGQEPLSPLQQHEKALADQAAYAAAMEKENLTGSQSISMVPERNARDRSKYTYEAGSNVSAGYT